MTTTPGYTVDALLQQAVGTPNQLRVLAKNVERYYAPKRPVFSIFERDADRGAIDGRMVKFDLTDVIEDYARLLELNQKARAAEIAASVQGKAAEQAKDGGEQDVRLFDSQWLNVVNHDHCYGVWSKEDAVSHAVKMTEQYMRENITKGWPESRQPLASQMRPQSAVQGVTLEFWALEMRKAEAIFRKSGQPDKAAGIAYARKTAMRVVAPQPPQGEVK